MYDEYTVTINGIDHTMRLSDDDAKRYNAKKVPASKRTRKSAVKQTKTVNVDNDTDDDTTTSDDSGE